ncbi:MAG: hypothetical protein FWJ93_15000 [Micromonosporaceae bacterium]
MGVLASSPLLVWSAIRTSRSLDACMSTHSARPDGLPEGRWACDDLLAPWAFAWLGLFGLLLITAATGLCVGVAEGRRRRSFANGRWVSAVVVGVAAPWALATYSTGYGLGRLLPVPKHQFMLQQGWEAALSLYRGLVAGRPLRPVMAPGFLADETVFMDASLMYSRFYGMNVTYQQSSTFAVGAPSFVIGAMLGNALGNSVAASRAASMARAQWREHRQTRVVVTKSATWCNVDGTWRVFYHHAVLGYVMDGPSSVLTFADIEPLRLAGPSAWCHAVLFTYLRYGAAGLRDAPFLQPVRAAASAVPLVPPVTSDQP